MSYNPLISVVIPVYNTKDYLKRAVDSVLNQGYKNLELVLVDDGSTDGSGALCDEIALLDSRVKVVHKINGGEACARIDGGNAATGEYVLFLDSDDWIAEGSVEALVNETFEGKADLVSAVLQTTNNNYLFTECQHGCEFHKLYDKNFIKNKLFNNDKVGVLGVHIGSLAEYLQDSFNRPGDRYISHATLVNVLYKRTIIEMANSEDLSFIAPLKRKADTTYKVVLYSFAESIVFTDTLLYMYFNRPDSEMRRSLSFKEAAALRYAYNYAKKMLIDRYIGGEGDEKYKCYLGSVILSYISCIIESHSYDGKEFKRLRNDYLSKIACKYYRGKGMPKKYRVLLYCYKHKLYFVFWLFSKFEKKLFKWKQ